MSRMLARFMKNESGTTAAEYGLIASLIALAIMVGASQLGEVMSARFDGIAIGLKG